jgi:hypothetical protein
LGVLVVVACLGIGSRRFAASLPTVVAEFAGDTLWAIAVFLGVGLIWPPLTTQTKGLTALAIALVVELSQLYHAPWIDAVRRTTFGGLALGFGFLWTDLVCYAIGIGFAVVVERHVTTARSETNLEPTRGLAGAATHQKTVK